MIISTKFSCLQKFFGLIVPERLRVFWIGTGNPRIDMATVVQIAKERAAALRDAKVGQDGIVDGDKVRFLTKAARIAALAAGEVSLGVIRDKIRHQPEPEPESAKILPFPMK